MAAILNKPLLDFSGKYAVNDPNDFVTKILGHAGKRGDRCCTLREIATRERWLMNAYKTPEGNFLHRDPKAVRKEALRRMESLNFLTATPCEECAQFGK
jgi:hypothetical protein